MSDQHWEAFQKALKAGQNKRGFCHGIVANINGWEGGASHVRVFSLRITNPKTKERIGTLWRANIAHPPKL